MLLRSPGIALVFGPALICATCAAPRPVGDSCDVSPGELVITELMVNPMGRYDTDHEWFEVYNAARSGRVLDRLIIRRLRVSEEFPTGEISKTHHVRFAGSLVSRGYFVFGDGPTAAAPNDYSYDDEYHPLAVGETLGALTNTAGGLELACGDILVDRVRWGRDVHNDASEPGRSVGLDGALAPDSSRNDDGRRWCAGGPIYDADGNRGTPGAANEVCP